MASLGERQAADFKALVLFAEELAESWRNGNKTDVLETLSDPARNSTAVALFVAESLGAGANVELGKALFVCNWEG